MFHIFLSKILFFISNVFNIIYRLVDYIFIFRPAAWFIIPFEYSVDSYISRQILLYEESIASHCKLVNKAKMEAFKSGEHELYAYLCSQEESIREILKTLNISNISSGNPIYRLDN